MISQEKLRKFKDLLDELQIASEIAEDMRVEKDWRNFWLYAGITRKIKSKLIRILIERNEIRKNHKKVSHR